MPRSRPYLLGAVAAGALGFAVSCSDAPPAPATGASALDPVSEASLERKADGAQIPFANLKMILEFNSTDNDLGVQLFLDGEDWQRIAGFDPRGQEFVEVETGGRLHQLGLTELFWESAEPSPAEVLALIPAGNYRYTGTTVAGESLTGTAHLSHSLPPAPSFTPTDGAVVDMNNFVITWQSIGGLASFQLIVVDEASALELVVDLRPSITSFRVPPEFLRRSTEYKIEVLAVAQNGNKTISEATVETQP
ncbi:MAG: hypothetical protein ACREOG_13535 [Gemmatimonadaceae bacterium]